MVHRALVSRLVCLFTLASPGLSADIVPVRHAEGRVRGFLVLKDLENRVLAIGDLAQRASGDRVSATLRFHFNDGSIHDETVEFTQRRSFRLRAYHLVQKGPTFPLQLDVALDADRHQVVVHSAKTGERPEEMRETLKLPTDLANGLVSTLVADIDPEAEATTLSLLATTPKPRLVHLEITPDGKESFEIAGSPLEARIFKVHIEIGGIAGVVAPLVGKQPPDTRIWIAGGETPGFLRSEGPLFEDGPVWRIELASPAWPAIGRGR
jgi:hypothetical protein